MSDETKVCPWCAETIKAAAIVCRYCGRDLPHVEVANDEEAFQRVRTRYGATFDVASPLLDSLPEPPLDRVAWVSELCNRITNGAPPEVAAAKIPLDWGTDLGVRERGPMPRVSGSFVQRIQQIGDVRGYTREQIENALGPPNSISAVAGGLVLQWQKTSALGQSYHFSLHFDAEERCRGITHQWVR